MMARPRHPPGPSRMKVLQLGKYYPPYAGGMESHLALLCEALRPEVELEVLVSNTGPRTVREVIAGVPLTRCAELLNLASTSINPTMPLELSRRDYDLLHLHFPHPMGALAYLASRKPRRHALVITYQSDIVRQVRLARLYAPLMHRVMAKAAAIICTSPQYLASSPTLQRFRHKCRIIPMGIDLSRWEITPRVEQEAAAIAARYPGRRLIAVGRLIYYKGFEHLIRAMASVDAQLLLVGDGPQRPKLLALARSVGVSERVHFLGSVPDALLPAHYRACQLFAFPSVARSEAYGLVQLEAMACGLPVVNTALDSGVTFVSRDGESGLTVPPGDARALAEAINRLLEDPALARGLGAGGRDRVEREFTREVMGERTLALYREVLGR